MAKKKKKKFELKPRSILESAFKFPSFGVKPGLSFDLPFKREEIKEEPAEVKKEKTPLEKREEIREELTGDLPEVPQEKPTFFTDPETGEETVSIKRGGKEFFIPKQAFEEATVRGAAGFGPKPAAALQAQQAAFEAQKKEAPVKEAIAKLTREELPIRRELDPEFRAGEEIPIVGGITAVKENILLGLSLQGFLGETMRKEAEKMMGAGMLDPEQLRTVALTEIERDVYEEGVTASELTGSLVEGIPVVGAAASKWSGGLIEEPSDNIKTILTELKGHRGRATKWETWARTGELNPIVVKRTIEMIEKEVQGLESRIKMLLNVSPELRFNSDLINKMEVDILRTREVLFESKLRATRMEFGEKVDPSEWEIASTLQEINGEEDWWDTAF